MATALALPKVFGARIAEAVLKAEKPVIVWLEFQDCAGNTESFLRATKPTVADIVLDVLSVDYHETIMAAAGPQAEDDPLFRSPARSAEAPRPRSLSGRARHSAASRPPPPTRPARWVWPTPCQG